MSYIGNYIQCIYKFYNAFIHYIFSYVIFWQLCHNSCVFLFKEYLYMKVEKDPYRYPYENRPIHFI